MKYILSTLFIAALSLIAALVMAPPPAKPDTSAKRQEICTRMWQDAALGAEKRTARQMCDALGVTP